MFGRMKKRMYLPAAPDATKEWHRFVSRDLRNHLAGKLVKAVFPPHIPHDANDWRFQELILFAQSVETDLFQCANNREEYYHLLAQKIYKIQTAPMQHVPQSLYSNLARLVHDSSLPWTAMLKEPVDSKPVPGPSEVQTAPMQQDPGPSSAGGSGEEDFGGQCGQESWVDPGIFQGGFDGRQHW